MTDKSAVEQERTREPNLIHVFTPLAIGPVTVPNRIVRSAHGTGLAGVGIGGDFIAYHEARARGGVGLTILEAAYVHPTSAALSTIPAWNDSIIPEYEQLMKRLKKYDMRVFQQLWHGGRHTAPADGSPSWSASAVPDAELATPAPLEMTHTQMNEIEIAFAAAARRAREGGLHGVEVHCAHGYLLNSFLTPLSNFREDEYGGSLENRLRFPIRVIRAVRDAVGPELKMCLRANRINRQGK